jgi:hypothetical protein
MLPKHIRKLLPILERKVSKVIPFRTHYRPAGTYENSYAYYKANRHRGAAYAEVYPDLVTRLPIPKDFYEKLSPYKLYDKVSAEDKRTLIAHASYRLVKIPGGRIVTDNTSVTAVISQDNKLVRDVSFQFPD